MRLSENMRKAIQAAGCEKEIEAIDTVIESLENSKTKNIAVLGETNCGKTSLINTMAGTEVRKPTKLSQEEPPLMVTFNSGETKPGYEVIDVRNSPCGEAQVSFYEIPLNMAVDSEKMQAKPMLEEMDAVIYIVSALTPFSASDVANIGVIIDRFPMLIYVSKAELLDSEEEYGKALAYIRNQFSENFGDTACEIWDSRQPDAVEAILEGVKGISMEELREYHIIRLEEQARDIIVEGLHRQIGRLERKRKEREAEKATTDAAYRGQLLEWDELRLEMWEKKQRAIDAAKQKIDRSNIAVKDKMLSQMKEADHKKEWMLRNLKKNLQGELAQISHTVMADLKDRAWVDASWLVGQVNRKWGINIDVEHMKENHVVCLKDSPDGSLDEPKKNKLVAAAGSGLIAGGALFSSLSLIPTCIVATPAFLAMLHFAKVSREEQERYNERLERITEECCDRNFAALAEQMRTAIDQYYDNILERIRDLGRRQEMEVDFSDIEEEYAEISEMLEELTRLAQRN